MFPVSLCLCPLRFIKADYPACRRRSTHSLLPLDLLTPPVACPQGAHAGEEGREGGTEDQLPPAIVLWCLAEGATPAPCFAGPSGPSGWSGGGVDGGGGTSLMPPAPPVWPQAQERDRLDALRYTQPHMHITAG